MKKNVLLLLFLNSNMSIVYKDTNKKLWQQKKTKVISMTSSTEKKTNHNLDHSQKMSTSVKSSDETHETHGMVTKLQNIKTCTDNDILAVLYNSDRILHKFYRFYTSPTFQINYLFSCKARETRKMFIKKSNNLDEHAFFYLW